MNNGRFNLDTSKLLGFRLLKGVGERQEGASGLEKENKPTRKTAHDFCGIGAKIGGKVGTKPVVGTKP